GVLDLGQGGDVVAGEHAVGDLEVLHRTLSLRAIGGVLGHPHLAHGVVLDTVVSLVVHRLLIAPLRWVSTSASIARRNNRRPPGVEGHMPPSNADRTDYIQPAEGWVRTQLEEIDAAGGDASVVQIKGRAVVVVTMIGARSGRPRRVPVMRVQDAGRY